MAQFRSVQSFARTGGRAGTNTTVPVEELRVQPRRVWEEGAFDSWNAANDRAKQEYYHSRRKEYGVNKKRTS